MHNPPGNPDRPHSAGRKLTWVIMLGAALVIALFLSTRGPNIPLPGFMTDDEPTLEDEEQATEPDAPAAPIAIYPAELHPAASRIIESPSDGLNLRWLVAPRDAVEAGQVIAEVSAPGQGDLLAQAEARLGVARHQVRTIGHLVAEGYEPQANLDRAQARLDAALAELEAAQQAASAVEIIAPVASIVSTLLTEEDATVEAGAEIARIRVMGDLLVTADLPAERVSRLRAGQSVTVNVLDRSHEGVVRRVGSAQGQQTARVEITLPYRAGLPVDGAPAEVVLPAN